MSTGSFAAAQQRILARQEARRLEAQNARHEEITRLQSSPVGRLPFPLNRTAGSLAHFYSVIAANTGTSPAVRVSQVDAELLDEELLTLLRTQITDALKYFSPALQDDYSREILLSLRFILFKLSIWDNDASYGASLQGLRYTDARQAHSAHPTTTQKSLYGLITVLGRYLWDKWEDKLLTAESSFEGPSPILRTFRTLTSRLTTLHSIAAFTSFAIFLVNGRYRTLTDRLLRLRLISPTAHSHREVSFEYLNRQLVWHAFTEFLLFLLPLVGISRWRRWLSRAWRSTKSALSADLSDTNTDIDKDSAKTGPLAFLPERTCAICYQDTTSESQASADLLGGAAGAGGVIGSIATDIVNPYETMPCACVYCFSCLATKIEAEDGAGWLCLRCGEVVLKCRPWRGDVVVSRPRRGEKAVEKRVGFVDDTDGADEEDGNAAGQVEKGDGYETAESGLGASKWQLESGT